MNHWEFSKPAFLRLLAAKHEIYSILQEGGSTKSRAEIDLLLLWIDDLQELVPSSFHQQLCLQWNIFWTNLWQFRAECGATPEGHGPWEQRAT